MEHQAKRGLENQKKRGQHTRFFRTSIGLAAVSYVLFGGASPALAQSGNTGAPTVLYFNGPQANVGPLAPKPSGATPSTPSNTILSHDFRADAPGRDPAAQPTPDSEDLDLSDGDAPAAPVHRPSPCAKNLNGSAIGLTPLAQKELGALPDAPSQCAVRELVLRSTRAVLLGASRELACPANSEPPAQALLAARQPEIDEQARSDAIVAKLNAQHSTSSTSAAEQDSTQKPWWAQLLAPFFDPILDRFGHLQTFRMQGSGSQDPLSDDDFKVPLEALQRSQLGIASMPEMAFTRINQLCPTWSDAQSQEFAPALSIVRAIAAKDGTPAGVVVEIRGASGPFAADKARAWVPLDGPLDWTASDLAGWLSQASLAKSHVTQLQTVMASDAADHWAAGLSGEGQDAQEIQPTVKKITRAQPVSASATSSQPAPPSHSVPDTASPAHAASSELLF